MSGHTPGPWHFDGDWHRIPTVFAGEVEIADVRKLGFPRRSDRTPEQEANARLIAAAPCLLEALETAQGNMMNVIVGLGAGDTKAKARADLKEAVRRAEAAITKARGGN